jgi:hypothetical protein
MAGFGMPLMPRCRLLAHCRWVRAVRAPLAVAVLLTGICLVSEARGQNDWQYPDPYFGILEIEKSHDAATRRRYRAEVSPAPQRDATTAPDRGTFGSAPADQAPANHAPAPRQSRFRWRTRSRR